MRLKVRDYITYQTVWFVMFWSIILLLVMSINKDVEYIGKGKVVECLPIKESFILGKIKKANIKIKGRLISNVRINDCKEEKEVSLHRQDKYLGIKSKYVAR